MWRGGLETKAYSSSCHQGVMPKGRVGRGRKVKEEHSIRRRGVYELREEHAKERGG